MHLNHVAHRYVFRASTRRLPALTPHYRDCTALNIMMDGSRMYPQSFHPIVFNKRPDYKGRAPHYTRTQKPPRYYVIDFGLSVAYDPRAGPPRFFPVLAADKTAPECQTREVGCDPFPTDVYYLGHWIELHFLQVCRVAWRPACSHA